MIKWYHRLIPTKMGLSFYIGAAFPYPLSCTCVAMKNVVMPSDIVSLENVVAFLAPQAVMYVGSRVVEFSALYNAKKGRPQMIDLIDQVRTGYFGTLFVNHSDTDNP